MIFFILCWISSDSEFSVLCEMTTVYSSPKKETLRSSATLCDPFYVRSNVNSSRGWSVRWSVEVILGRNSNHNLGPLQASPLSLMQ